MSDTTVAETPMSLMLKFRILWRRLRDRLTYRHIQKRRQHQITREIENLLSAKEQAESIRRRQELNAVVTGRFGRAK